jgi:hypothetical protein
MPRTRSYRTPRGARISLLSSLVPGLRPPLLPSSAVVSLPRLVLEPARVGASAIAYCRDSCTREGVVYVFRAYSEHVWSIESLADGAWRGAEKQWFDRHPDE